MGEAITWKFEDRFMPEQGFLLTRTKGVVSYYELLQHPEIFMRYEGFTSGLNILYDFHLVTRIDVDERLLGNSISLLNNEGFIPVEAKTAFVLPENDLIMMRSAEKICEALCQTRVEHRAFCSFAQAMQFLDKPYSLLNM